MKPLLTDHEPRTCEWMQQAFPECEVLHADITLVKDINEFPADLRIREYPERSIPCPS